MSQTITIVDYGAGNMQSVIKTLGLVGVSGVISSDPDLIISADKLILPGVGHFGKVMGNLRNRGLKDALDEAVLKRNIPILGICLGMQLMAKYSSEGNEEGLGWFDGSVVRFDVQDELRYKVPHIGWNQAQQVKSSIILNNIDQSSEFYFLHSFHYVTETPSEILMNTSYSYNFVSAIEKRNIYGVQFHPEKSHEVGLNLLKNFAVG